VLRSARRYDVVVYRAAGPDVDELVTFSRSLGGLLPVSAGAEPTHPEVAVSTLHPDKSVLAEVRKGTFFWHLDRTPQEVPEKATLLMAIEVSAEGGDTEFANTHAAYDALPAARRVELEQLRVVHSFTAAQLLLVHPDADAEQRAKGDRIPAREHPLAWKRRDGRSSLLIGATAERVVGRPESESRALLDELLQHATRPEFVYRHGWTRGDLVVWDNTGMLHRAIPYEPTSRRLMHRTTLVGEEAVA